MDSEESTHNYEDKLANAFKLLDGSRIILEQDKQLLRDFMDHFKS